jgi:hypothetical protein
VTPEELSRAVREAFAYAARYVSLLVQNNPAGAAGELLSRPDVDAVLADTLDRAREAAAEAVRQEWAAGGGPQHDYLSWLTDDVDRSYEALGRLRTEIRRAHAAVPQRHFEPGTSTPGTAPAAESARERAAAVRDAVLHTGSELAQRSRLTLEVASAAAVTFREIEEGTQQAMAGAHVWKQWQCRSWPAPPDARTCHWCRALNGFIVPLHGNFPPGSPADLSGHGRLTRPPRLYRGMLQGPPRHPRCRCRIKILRQLPASPVPSGTGGQGGAAAAAPLHGAVGRTGPPGGLEDPGSLLAAADIRALPEDKYQALAAFLKAATHELGQAVARLRKVLGE